MSDEVQTGDGVDEVDSPGLPKHLASLVGALQGPADLGRNHDRYLTYPRDGEPSGGAASA